MLMTRRFTILSPVFTLALGALPGVTHAQCTATVAQTEGPYYRVNPPLTQNFRPDGLGTPLDVRGVVRDVNCNPIVGADVDFWHADNAGAYDNSTYRFRGHFPVNSDGSYFLETILPGLYPGRTRHIHFKVRPPGGSVLTSQLYFPGEPGNASDGIYNPALLMTMSTAPDGDTVGTYHFTLPVACASIVTQPPATRSVSAGDGTSLSVAPGGSLPITYQWKKNGVNVSDEPGHIAGANSPTLVLTAARATDAGNYSCSLSNVCTNNVTSSAVVLSVSPAACPADLDDGSATGTPDGGVTIDDLVYFLVAYAAGNTAADLDNGTGTGTRDGGVTIDDLVYYLTRFQGGC